MPQVPAVKFALGVFLEAYFICLCLEVFVIACAFVLCGMLVQSVNGTAGDERYHILSNL